MSRYQLQDGIHPVIARMEKLLKAGCGSTEKKVANFSKRLLKLWLALWAFVQKEPKFFLGRHFLIEMYQCDPGVINNVLRIKRILIDAAKTAGCRIVDTAFHRFEPYGISGVVMIAESHLFAHTWPEHGFATADIFTCGGTLSPAKAATVILQRFKPKRHKILRLKRGGVI